MFGNFKQLFSPLSQLFFSRTPVCGHGWIFFLLNIYKWVGGSGHYVCSRVWLILCGVGVFTSMCFCASIFGHEGQDADDVVYINWLSMVRAGLLGLEFYTPESKSWRQVMCLLTEQFSSY